MTLNAGAVFNMAGDNTIGMPPTCSKGSGFTGPALSLNGGTLDFDLSSTGADSLQVTKSALVSGANVINLTTIGANLSPGNTYNLITASTGLAGTSTFSNGSASELVLVGGSRPTC